MRRLEEDHDCTDSVCDVTGICIHECECWKPVEKAFEEGGL